MEKEDARYQSLERLHERRKQVVRLHKKGIKIMQIVKLTGLSYPTVRRSIELYESGNWEALRPAQRGRSKGQGRVLTGSQEEAIRGSIIEQRPEQLKMACCLWSRRAVMLLIEQLYGITLPVRTVGKYLARWGFTPQKPIKKAYEQRPEAPRQCRPGSRSSTPLLRRRPGHKAQRFIGVTKRHWSIRTFGDAVTRLRAKRRWPLPRAARATSCP
jgi:transposase